MRIKRYLKLLWEFFKFSFKSEIEYRGNLVFYSVQNFLWLALGVIGINLIYGQVQSIAGWEKNEVFLVLFVATLYTDLSWTFIFNNLKKFSKLIRKGTLDYYLLMPVNLRFFLSTRFLEFDHYARIILSTYLIYRYTIITVGYLSLINLLTFVLVFVSGFIIFYSIFFAFTATNVWFVKLENLVDLFSNVKNLGSKPVYIFDKGFLIFFSYIIPVGYIATFPAQALMGELSLLKTLMAPILAVIFYWLSQKFFYFAMRYYTSASS